MNLFFQIHQYRVTSLRSSAELHLGAGHGTRHDLFLPSLFPLRRPTRKVVSGSELLSSAWRLRKSVNLKTASPGLASLALWEPLSLSGCTVSVCRELYTNQPHTSSQFLNKFSLFCHIFCKPLKTQCKNFALFCPKNHFSQKLVDFMQEKWRKNALRNTYLRNAEIR